MNKLLITMLLMSCTSLLHAATINLECEILAEKTVNQLVDEGLLLPAEQYQIRARAISVEICSGAQEVAEIQHQQSKDSALKNWIFEKRPDKPGNKRLKRLK